VGDNGVRLGVVNTEPERYMTPDEAVPPQARAATTAPFDACISPR